MNNCAASEFWEVRGGDHHLSVHSSKLAFELTSAQGGRLLNLRWPEWKNLPSVQQIQPVLYAGILYDPRQWNILAEGVRGGEESPVTWRIEGAWLILNGKLLVHDLEITTEFRACAETGLLDCQALVKKNGPGSIKAQLLWMTSFQTAGSAVQPPSLQTDFFADGRLQTASEFGSQGTLLDQDGHAANRYWSLSSPEVRFRSPGHRQALAARLDASMVGLSLYHRPTNQRLNAGLYASDQILEGAATLASSLGFRPIKLGDEESPGLPDLRNPQIAEAIVEETRPLQPQANQAEAIRDFRTQLHHWLLEEARWYWTDGNDAEARGLLADAARTRSALERGESAALPEKGDEIYSASFRELPADWKVFGFGTLRADSEEGLYVAPNTTMNLWSDAQFSGDYVVEFFYRPEPMEKRNCGTFLQFSGRPVVERDPVDMMASATGRMPDYNFGVKCYHFSFNRLAPARDRTNFRKTGEAFRLLALTERATASEPSWHKITAARRGSQFLLYINDEFVLEYFDEGNRGPVYETGRLGLRNWGGMKAWFRDLTVYRPAEK